LEGGRVLKPAAELERHRAAVTCVGFSPNGALLATADSNRELLLWDTHSMQVNLALQSGITIIAMAAITIT
jgi:WD40 repeat protein